MLADGAVSGEAALAMGIGRVMLADQLGLDLSGHGARPAQEALDPRRALRGELSRAFAEACLGMPYEDRRVATTAVAGTHGIHATGRGATSRGEVWEVQERSR